MMGIYIENYRFFIYNLLMNYQDFKIGANEAMQDVRQPGSEIQ
jgi:hypothetical protein